MKTPDILRRIELSPPQLAFMSAWCNEILYGGAAGGGKSFIQVFEALWYAIEYPGSKQISGNELADQMIDQVLTMGADVNLEEVTDIKLLENGAIKQVITEDGDYLCRSVILATGVKHRLLGVPGEEEMIGNGVSFCAVCDGAFYQDQHVAVIGGGNSALQEAVLLSETCSKVTVVQNLDYFTGEVKLLDILRARDNVELITGTVVTEILADGDTLRGIRIAPANGGEPRELSCDGVFVAIGLIPANAPFASLANLNDWGYFDADENCTTQTPGIYVAGDCRAKRIRQITTAVADGAVAALAACRYLDE